jgi:hypothetical protein
MTLVNRTGEDRRNRPQLPTRGPNSHRSGADRDDAARHRDPAGEPAHSDEREMPDPDRRRCDCETKSMRYLRKREERWH